MIKAFAKVDNRDEARSAKIEIRQRVLAAIGIDARVYDAYAGEGHMHDAVWREARSYTGCDVRWFNDKRLMYCADTRRVLRAIPLGGFNLFDLDAYGSPWDTALIIAARRTVRAGELIGLVLTEGNGLAVKTDVPHAIRALTGIRPGVAGFHKLRDQMIDRAVLGVAKRMRCEVVKRWQASAQGGVRMRYIGLVLRGLT
jgi:hypothetical protein